MEYLCSFLACFLDNVPLVVFIYYLYKNNYTRYPKLVVLIVAAAILVIGSAVFAIVFHENKLSEWKWNQVAVLVRYSVTIISSIWVFFSFPKNIGQTFYIISFTFPTSSLVLSVTAYLDQFFKVAEYPEYYTHNVVRIALFTIFSYPIYSFMKYCVKRSSGMGGDVVWRFAGLISIISIVIAFVNNTRLYVVTGIAFEEVLNAGLVELYAIVVLLILLQIIVISVNSGRLMEQTVRLKQLSELKEQQYSRMANDYEVMRKIRHDLRHHITFVSALLKDKKYDTAQEYINSYYEKIPNASVVQICTNDRLNTLLNYFNSVSNQNDIKISFKVSTDQRVDDIILDVITVIGNCLENAIDACCMIDQSDRAIEFSMHTAMGCIYIVCSNTFDGKLVKQDDQYMSHKLNYKKAGTGITSIQSIVERYDGEMRIKVEDKRFVISIQL